MKWIETLEDDDDDTGPIGSHSDHGPGPIVAGCGVASAVILITGAALIIYRLFTL